MVLEMFKTVSKGIGVDSQKRIWVATMNRQLRNNEMLGGTMGGNSRKSIPSASKKTDAYKLEIFSPDGKLIHEIPLTHYCDNMRMIDDRIFIFDRNRGMCVYEYKIKE